MLRTARVSVLAKRLSDALPLGATSRLAGLYALAAIVSAWLGVAPSFGVTCGVCTGGALSVALPWLGFAFYTLLSIVAATRPVSLILSLSPGCYLVVHGALVAEMLHRHRWCSGCLVVGVLALAAAGTQSVRLKRDLLMPVIAIAMGASVGLASPFERVDAFLTRTLWPSRQLDSLPAWINRTEVTNCEHSSAIRVLVYERNCKSCGSAARWIAPLLEREYPSRVCLHLQEISTPVAGQRLPVVILVSRHLHLTIIEGMPDAAEFKVHLSGMLGESGVPPTSDVPK